MLESRRSVCWFSSGKLKTFFAVKQTGKEWQCYAPRESIPANTQLFPRPDWMKGSSPPGLPFFLLPSLSSSSNPIFQQEFDVWTLGIHRHPARYCCQDTFLASSGFRKCSRNGKYSGGIIRSGSNGTEADKVGGFGFRGLVYMNLFSGSEDAQRCGGNSGSMWCFWITHQRTVRFQIMWLLVCSLIAALSGENYATQAQVMSSKALRASNARSNGEFGRYGDLKSH